MRAATLCLPPAVASWLLLSCATPEAGAQWYGYQTLATDAAGVATTAVGVVAESVPTAGTGLVVVGVGAPIVHFVHGEPSRGILSLALRSASAGLAVVTAGSAACPDRRCASGAGTSLLVVAGVGLLVAAIVDASIAWDDPPRRPYARRRR